MVSARACRRYGVVDSSGAKGRVLAWLLRADAHTGVASPAAIRLAGITAHTPDPPGGVIVKTPSGGNHPGTATSAAAAAGGGTPTPTPASTPMPTGVLRDNAMTLVTSLIPPKSEADRVRAFKRAFRHLLSLGVTSVCDFGDIDHLAAGASLVYHIHVYLFFHPSRSVVAREGNAFKQK